MNRLDKKYHIGFWIVKIAIIFVFFQFPNRHENELFWLASPLTILFHIGYFYGIYSIVFPQFFEKKKYFEFAIGALLLTLTHTVGLWWIWGSFKSILSLPVKPFIPGFIGANFVFFGISFTWRHLNFIIEDSQKKYQLRQELKGSELRFLQSQINPHFLFNILGCINGLAITKSDKTEFAIMHLNSLIQISSKMRGGEKIDLYDELEFLKSYTHLQEMRYAVPVKMKFPLLERKQLVIEPMLLIPIIENAFEHGDLSESGGINLKISIRKNLLIMKVENKIAKDDSAIHQGKGISKLKKRLGLIYEKKYELDIQQSGTNYSANLQLKLNVSK